MNLTPGLEYEVAVVLKGKDGSWGSPSAVTPTVIVAEEFAPFSPPNCTNGVAVQRAYGADLSWEAVRHDSLQYYEVRRVIDDRWNGAEVVGRTYEPRLSVLDLPVGDHRFHVRARHTNGIYSPTPLLIEHTQAAPFEWPVLVEEVTDDPTPGSGGTLTNVEVAADGSLVLEAGAFHGTYESAPLELATPGIYWWSVGFTKWEEETTPLEEATYAWDSGEARWRTLDGREATIGQPGSDHEALDTSTAILEDENYTLVGRRGIPGTHTRVLAEMAFADVGGGTYGPWLPAASGVYAQAGAIKLRFTFDRWSERFQPHLAPPIHLSAHART